MPASSEHAAAAAPQTAAPSDQPASSIGSSMKHPESVPALLTSLYDLRKSNPKAVRNNIYPYPAEIYSDNGEGSSTGQQRDRRITSWKMTEHMYFKANNVFPTLARGLFTEEIASGDEVPPGLAESEGREVWEDISQESESTGEAVSREKTQPKGMEVVDDGGQPKERRKSRFVKERIVARGYDKFFNIEEVPWTYWESMEKYTEAPYHLTLKSNGCLILISALSPSHLLVASKHSLGTTPETDVNAKIPESAAKGGSAGDPKEKKSQKGKEKEADAGEVEDRTHASVGREWVKRTLKAKGKTEVELARRLWDQNLSAVLELCDDSFEEHVIATPEYWTGLHLHGLNHNTPHFSTLPPDDVTSFAAEFGFIPTKTVKLNTLEEVRSFTNDVAKTGSWEGDMIEGFVVRSTVRKFPADEMGEGQPPYLPGAPFFFKVKFDEPYLLYRQWREVTRFMLPLLDGETPREKRMEIWSGVKKRLRRPEMAVYADWVGRTIVSDPGLFENFDRGVVRVRDAFLRWTEGEGAEAWAQAQKGEYKFVGSPELVAIKEERQQQGKKGQKVEAPRDISSLPKKWIIVPCAVPGCGKTLVGLALARLFGFGHTQSDDVTTKRTAPTFLKNIETLLKTQDVVYADRNNHIDKHYNELAELHNSRALKAYNVRLIAVLWDVERQPYYRVLRVCSERVVGRGDNHQTLRPDLTADAEHEAVVSSFIRKFEIPDEAKFDHIIDVSITDTPFDLVRQISAGLVGPLNIPSVDSDQIQSALDEARGYTVVTPYHPPDKLGRAIRYFGLAPEIDLAGIVEVGIYYMPPELAHSAQRFLFALQAKKRVIGSPHVTLVHELSVKEETETLGAQGMQGKAWDDCVRLVGRPENVMWEFEMTHVVWNDRVMAIVVDNLNPPSQEGMESLAQLVREETKEGAHITVGTKEEDIRPYEARTIVEFVKKRIVAGEVEGEAQGYTVEGLNVADESQKPEGGAQDGQGESDGLSEDEKILKLGGMVRWARLGPTKGEGRVKGMW